MKRMKKTKRFLAVFCAVVLAFAMNITAFAGNLGTGQGSITITNATVGEDYTIYKIFDTDATGQGNITATKAQKDFYESQADNPFEFSENSAGTYNVSIKADSSADAVIEFLQDFVTEEGIDDGFEGVVDASAPENASSATVEFDNIPYGYYLVSSSLGAVITVDSTNPDQTVIDKNQDGGSKFTKKVNGEDEVVQIGESYTYTLEFDATNYDGETEITEYTITDTLGTGMALDYTAGEAEAGTYGVIITVGETEVDNATITYDTESNQLKIVIPWVNVDNKFSYTSPSHVTVTYDAVLTADAEIQKDIINNATLTWDGNKEGTSTTVTVQTYALAIMKVDPKGNPLDGAEFAVTVNGVPVNVSPVEDEGNEGVYVVDPDSESNIAVSPESGLIVIKGVDNIEYTLTETTAPDGYNLLGAPVTVMPASTGSTTITIYYDADGNVVATETEGGTSDTANAAVPVTYKVVINEEGSTLPSTGGMGTTALYIAGIALVIGAGVVLVVRRRMNAE